MAKVRVRHGSEGPRHDPYAFTEVKFHPTDETKPTITVHFGLVCWVQKGEETLSSPGADERECEILFNQLSPIPFDKAVRIPDKLLERYLRSLPKHERYAVMACIDADEAMLRNAY